MSPPSTTSASTARDRATGQARYTADLVPPGAVVVGIARSPYPHARIARVDIRHALDVPGVLGVLTPADFEGIRLGHLRADEPVLTDVARYVGEGIAAVAATDPEALAQGIKALVVEYEILPHALSVDESATLLTPIHESCPDNVAARFVAERGKWDTAAARVAVWAEGTFRTDAVPHAYLEPRACYVHYKQDHLDLVVGSHAPWSLAENYRQIVERWGTSLNVITPNIGGSFGAKWEHPMHLICLAFAHRLKCDVAMVFSRREDMIAGRTRVAMRIHLRVGATLDGELVVKDTVLFADNGAYSLHGPAVMAAAVMRADNLYRFSAVRADARLIYTNNIPSECFRGFGMPQATFALEQLIDELARRLEIDPVQFRRSNAVRSGDTTIHGWRIGSCGLNDCLDAVSARMAEHHRTFQVPANGRYRVGYGMAAAIHCISNRGHDARFDGANVTLSIESDGKICIRSAEVELGCGTIEVLTTLVARELDTDRDRLRVVLADTASGPYGLGNFASRTSFFIGQAALDACRHFKDACRRLGTELRLSDNATIIKVVDAATKVGRRNELRTSGTYEPVNVDYPKDSGYGNISPAYTFGVHGCCVRVDILTGKILIDQYWAAHDAGTILNPNGAVGQVIGGVVQGLGFALREALAVNVDGHVLNPGFLDTRVATFPDAAPIDVMFVPTFETNGPAGAKTIGEPPLIPVAGCVANAVYDALRVRQYCVPMTSERVWRSLRSSDRPLPPV